MSYRERIAFAMFKSDYPDYVASEMKLDDLGVVEVPVVDNVTCKADLSLDWDMNKEDFLRHAEWALKEVNEIIAETHGRSLV